MRSRNKHVAVEMSDDTNEASDLYCSSDRQPSLTIVCLLDLLKLLSAIGTVRILVRVPGEDRHTCHGDKRCLTSWSVANARADICASHLPYVIMTSFL